MTKTSTQPFTTSSGDYLFTLMCLWVPHYGWTVAVPVVLFAVVGVLWDVRFLLISLMLLFIVVPMLMSFLYIYYMLTPEARMAVIRKTVEIDEGHSLRLVYLPPEQPVSAQRHGDDSPGEDIFAHVPEPETIGWDEIKKVKYTSRFVVYIFHAPRLRFLLVPYTAFKKS